MTFTGQVRRPTSLLGWTFNGPCVHAFCQCPLVDNNSPLVGSAQFDPHLPLRFDPNLDFQCRFMEEDRIAIPIDVHPWRHTFGVRRLQP